MRSLELISHLWREITETEAPAHLSLALTGRVTALSGAATKRFQSDRHCHHLAVAENGQLELCARLFLSDDYLEFSRIVNLVTVNFSNDVTDLQARFCSRRIGFDLCDHPAHGRGISKEFRIFWSHVRNSNPDVPVANLAIANERFHRRSHDLSR